MSQLLSRPWNGTRAARILDVERQGDTLIVTPVADLRELDDAQIAAGGKAALQALQEGTVRQVVVDLQRQDQYDSTALGFFICLWRKVRTQGGNLALCNVADHTLENLRMMNLDRLWRICASRDEALRRPVA